MASMAIAEPDPRGNAKPGAPARASTAERDVLRRLDTWMETQQHDAESASISYATNDIFVTERYRYVVVTELHASQDSCKESTIVLEFPGTSGDAEVVRRTTNCCPDEVCTGRSANGWMIELSRLIETRDAEGIRRLIDPKAGLPISAQYYADDRKTEISLTRETSAAGLWRRLRLHHDPLTHPISCHPETLSAGTADCHSAGVHYTWKKQGDSVYLSHVGDTPVGLNKSIERRFDRWLAERRKSRSAEGTPVKHKIFYRHSSIDGNGAASGQLLLSETTPGTDCRQLIVGVELWGADEPSVAEYGPGCCGTEQCSEETPIAKMVQLDALLRAKNLDAARHLVHPTTGLKFVSDFGGDGLNSQVETHASRATSHRIFEKLGSLFGDESMGGGVSCGSTFDGDGRRTCRSGDSIGADFVWERGKEGTFLIEINEQGH